jgi:hypothetical protein
MHVSFLRVVVEKLYLADLVNFIETLITLENVILDQGLLQNGLLTKRLLPKARPPRPHTDHLTSSSSVIIAGVSLAIHAPRACNISRH